jgi:3-oxoacyl-[acyl-carrier protein] reductase
MSKVALVTGASGGIGSAIARRLAGDGCTVLVGYNANETAASEIAETLAGNGHRAVRVAVDDSPTLNDLAATITDELGRLDVLVNCAGVTEPVPHGDLDGLSDELIDRIFATNWRGPFATIRAMRQLLTAAPDGVIVNISSVAAITGQGSNVAYCASKAALDSMTRSLARALGPEGIRVVSVSPGWVRGRYADRMPPDLLAVQERATPMGRLALPEDVAAAVSAVIHELTFTTGVAIAVDGGRPLGST